VIKFIASLFYRKIAELKDFLKLASVKIILEYHNFNLKIL
tara:strand:- start:1619 stop:1738 length:120 start_codon:yes stop_codon:yes gene_type:complete